MCHFITLVLPGAVEDRARVVLERHGRVLRPISNATVAALLASDERQFLTSPHCDCGSALGEARDFEMTVVAAIPRQRERLSRIGWSETKIERWVRDRQAAEKRPRPGGPDSLALWETIFTDLFASGVARVGLLLHCYSGALTAEFDCERGDVVGAADRARALAWIEEDRLVTFLA